MRDRDLEGLRVTWKTYTVIGSIHIPIRAESPDDAIEKVRVLCRNSERTLGEMTQERSLDLFIPLTDPDFNPDAS